MLRKVTGLLLLSVLLVVLQTACGMGPVNVPQATQVGTFSIDPLFYEYYQDLGGTEVVGSPISALFEKDGMYCQYTSNLLLCQNPLITGIDRYFLWPIGLEMGIGGQPQDSQPIGGITIFPDFNNLYYLLGGPVTIGPPLSNPVYNHDKQRIEQYFEKAGFYHLFDETEGAAHLLPYGKYACGETCASYMASTEFTGAIPQSNMAQGSLFSISLDRIGGEQTFGRPLTDPYHTTNGDMEQVYENIVLYSPAENPSLVRFRPISRILGMHTVDPMPRDPTKGNVIFHETSGGLGYHVPLVFDQFIALHGSFELSGPPIADTILYSQENVIRQCFENYCLDFYPTAPEDMRVRVAPLGLRYLSMTNPTLVTNEIVPMTDLDFIVSEGQPQLPPGETQRIYILVFEKNSQAGIPGMSANVIVKLDGNPVTYMTPPTDVNGWVNLSIPPHSTMTNGTLVPYDVCLMNASGEPLCKHDSYLIWAP